MKKIRIEDIVEIYNVKSQKSNCLRIAPSAAQAVLEWLAAYAASNPEATQEALIISWVESFIIDNGLLTHDTGISVIAHGIKDGMISWQYWSVPAEEGGKRGYITLFLKNEEKEE
jgi:hypothetical protein